jgi:hypothetical protein
MFYELLFPGLIGLAFVLIAFGLIVIFAAASRRRPGIYLREIPAFSHLARAIGLAVEAGKRLHISLGRGGLNGLQTGSALIGLSVLERIALSASISDHPPLATSGDGSVAILSQETLGSSYRAIHAYSQYDPTLGQVAGLTPFSYAAGAIPVIFDEQVSASILMGNYGTEVALITDASERKDSLTLAGSDNLTAQAILYAAGRDTLIGEDLYAASAYLSSGPIHYACLRSQDILRWILIVVIILGAGLNFLGIL